jgi:hypothetical protein
MPDDLSLQSRVARLALSSADREQAKSGRLRGHFAGSEFARLYADMQAKFGPGVRIVYFKAGGDQYGKPLPPGIPFSDPPPEPLGRKRK